MAKASLLAPFILKAEGGLSRATTDEASAHPCPFPNPKDGLTGYHTNKGVTWDTWSSKFGDDEQSANRFFIMAQIDWLQIFVPFFWDAALATQINDQRIADMIADEVWMSGKHSPEKDAQDVLDTLFGGHLVEDGNFGTESIKAINSVPQDALYADITARRIQMYENIASVNPAQSVNLNGWVNRVNELVEYNKQF